MTDPSPSTDELEERGRAIFARLRDDPAAPDGSDPSNAPPSSLDHQGDASVSDDMPATPDGGSTPAGRETNPAPDAATAPGAGHGVGQQPAVEVASTPPVATAPTAPAELTSALDGMPATPEVGVAPAIDAGPEAGHGDGEQPAVEVASTPPVATAPTAPAELTSALGEVSGQVDEPLVAAKPVYGDVRPPLPRIIAVANQKGGVGKTTTAVNLGACLADLGYRTLVVDLDPQGNASTGLGINIRGLQASMYDVILSDVPIEDCVEASSVRNLFVAPASLDLAGAEIELVPAFSRELRLKQALAEVRDDYDYVLIDCPPSLGLLTINGMAAATEVLVPIQCEYYALEGLGQLLRNVGLVQKNLNPTLEVSTIVLVMYDARTKLSDQVAKEVREHFGPKVCRIMIPRTVRLSEAPSFGQPIIAFDPSSRGAIAYRELAKEVSGGPA
ncbi:MAG: AAA family ATPase [Aquihabitans sp.]